MWICGLLKEPVCRFGAAKIAGLIRKGLSAKNRQDVLHDILTHRRLWQPLRLEIKAEIICHNGWNYNN